MKDHRSILVVTSEPSPRQEIVDCLSAQGLRAVAVERGSDALLAVAEDNICLVVLDLSVQEPSGARTFEILRKMRPRLPVIVLSGDSSVETGRQILQLGVFYYLLKPLNLEELDQVVRLALALGKRLGAGMDEGALTRGLRGEKGALP